MAHFFPHLLCQKTVGSPSMWVHQELTTQCGARAGQDLASAFLFPLLTDFQPPEPPVLKHAELLPSSKAAAHALLSA